MKNFVSNAEFYVCRLFPDLSDLDYFDSLVERVVRILRSLRERRRIVIDVFTSSRLEVSTTVLLKHSI